MYNNSNCLIDSPTYTHCVTILKRFCSNFICKKTSGNNINFIFNNYFCHK